MAKSKDKNNTYSCMPSFHPNFLINQPSQKINSWQILRNLKFELIEINYVKP